MNPPTTRTRMFGLWLLGVVGAGVMLRLAHDLVVLQTLRLGVDSTWYFLEAGVIRADRAYAVPDVFAVERAATAAWPPLYPVFLALVQAFAGDSIRASQLAGVRGSVGRVDRLDLLPGPRDLAA